MLIWYLLETNTNERRKKIYELLSSSILLLSLHSIEVNVIRRLMLLCFYLFICQLMPPFEEEMQTVGGYIEMAFQPDLNHIDKREKERTCHQWKTQESFNKATVVISTSMPW